jgi:3',5'-cyclic AMP phosphodiesterase CpdA
MTLVLAHLSDLHLPPDDAPTIRQLLGKRLLSYMAWRRKRDIRDRDVPPALLAADLAASGADLLALTGDLTNFALPGEFAAAARFLRGLGRPEDVLVIPGNHDALVAVPPAEGLDRWAPWMRGDAGEAGFPFLRRRGGVALLGLCSAVVTPPGSAAGRLGGAQLERLAALLRQLGREGLFRVVLIHHPPCGEGRRRGLQDREALLRVLAAAGAELLLHGHSHRPGLTRLPGPGGQGVPAVGVPPALAGAARRHPARWHRYAITPAPGGWVVEALVRGWRPEAGGFATLGRWRLRVDRPAPERPLPPAPEAGASRTAGQ